MAESMWKHKRKLATVTFGPPYMFSVRVWGMDVKFLLEQFYAEDWHYTLNLSGRFAADVMHDAGDHEYYDYQLY